MYVRWSAGYRHSTGSVTVIPILGNKGRPLHVRWSAGTRHVTGLGPLWSAGLSGQTGTSPALRPP